MTTKPSLARISVALIAYHLYFYKIPAPGLPGETGDPDGLLCVPGAGGVGKEGDVAGYVVQDIGDAAFICPPQGKGDDLGFCLFYGCLDQIQGILSRSQNKT